jgi:hypothetical protein
VPVKVRKRQLIEDSTEEFSSIYYKKKSWQEMFSNADVNTTFNVFMDTITQYFHRAFPIKKFM